MENKKTKSTKGGKSKNGKFDQHVGTKLGAIVLVIVAITVGMVSWKIAKDREGGEVEQKVAVQPKMVEKSQEQQNKSQQQSNNQSQGTFKSRFVGNGCYAMKNGQKDETHFRSDFNTAPANSTVHYENKDLGISFDIPYNKSWGNKDCEVLPYLQLPGSNPNFIFEFGLPRAFITSQFHFEIKEKKVDVSNLSKVDKGILDQIPKTEKIGNFDVMTYSEFGAVDSVIIVVPGKSKDYFFTEIAPKINNKISSDLENIIRSIKFI